MKLITILVVASLAAFLFASSCFVTSHDINVEISCDQFNENAHLINEFQIETGDKIRVNLCSNPSTGFQWGYETSTSNILNEEDHDFEEPAANATGAAGTETWTFEAVEKGTVEVHMAYSQPWEGGQKEERTYTMYVTVD